MRFASFLDAQSRLRVGIVHDGAVYACPAGQTLLELLSDEVALRDAGERALANPAFVTPVDKLDLLAPVPVPPSFRDFLSFEQHLRTVSGRAPDADWYQMPVFYFSNPAGIFGPRSPIPVPPGCTKFDYELEVAAVIGQAGFNLSPDEAEAHIAGYLVLGDFTARDLQAAEMKLMLGPAKGKDTASSCGPWLVTADELHSRRSQRTFDLEMTASVNGRPYSRGRLDTMHWSFPELVAYASRGTHVRPGDIIGSGTVGRGCILELSLEYGEAQYPWLAPGDEVVLEVEALGALTHRIVPGAELHPLRDSRSPGDPHLPSAAGAPHLTGPRGNGT